MVFNLEPSVLSTCSAGSGPTPSQLRKDSVGIKRFVSAVKRSVSPPHSPHQVFQ